MPATARSTRRVVGLVAVVLAVVLSLLVGVVGAGALLLLFGASAALAADVFPWLVAAAFLTQSAVVLCAALAWFVVSRTAMAVGDRLYLGAVEVESRHRWAEWLRLADRFAPLTRHDTDAVSRLQRRYVGGDVDEQAFERELDRLLDEAEAHEADDQPTGGPATTAAGGPRSEAVDSETAERARTTDRKREPSVQAERRG